MNLECRLAVLGRCILLSACALPQRPPDGARPATASGNVAAPPPAAGGKGREHAWRPSRSFGAQLTAWISFLITPIPLISVSMMSPGFKYIGGFML